MEISVVIPALDEQERVAGAIESARAPGVEIVVVDGGSRDATVARAAALGARVVASAPGRARQLEVGARETRGEAIVFLHADTRLPAGWAEAVRDVLRDPAATVGAFRLRFEERSLALRVVEWGARLRAVVLRLPYGDQALFARRRALEEIGGVPQAPVMEDLDLVRALRRRGRLVLLRRPITTSARRYREGGVLRTWALHAVAVAAWRLGLDRARVAAWLAR